MNSILSQTKDVTCIHLIPLRFSTKKKERRKKKGKGRGREKAEGISIHLFQRRDSDWGIVEREGRRRKKEVLKDRAF